MNFFGATGNWFGRFFAETFQKLQREVYYRTGHSGAFGFIMAAVQKWYLLVMIPAVTALYWVIKGLDDAGILDNVYAFIQMHLEDVVRVAKECTPKITNIKSFYECL